MNEKFTNWLNNELNNLVSNEANSPLANVLIQERAWVIQVVKKTYEELCSEGAVPASGETPDPGTEPV